jgi:NAD+ synthetase
MLPNYRVFDEQRYFTAGKDAAVFSLNGIRIGLNICEDVWRSAPAAASRAAGAEMIVAINGSPYELESQQIREAAVRARINEVRIPAVYINMVGGQDELVFDGGSFAMDASGEICFRAEPFKERLMRLELRADASGVRPERSTISPYLPTEPSVYEALVTGTRDYVTKNGFGHVVVGLSGGIDSALVAVIACDALGVANVTGVTMPSPYSSSGTRRDAARVARNLGIEFLTLPITGVFKAYRRSLGKPFKGLKEDLTEENLQARIRGNFLMALSNKFGWLVLTTGNKSEIGVGYSTLYGDMAGGFAVIKDVPKTLVYRLAAHANARAGRDLIPRSIFERAPSAELRPDQTDQDTLPPYPVLDAILEAYVEEDQSLQDIVARGFDAAIVKRVIAMVDRNEYKRRQGPIGIKITPRAFGRDWRLPIVNRFRE